MIRKYLLQIGLGLILFALTFFFSLTWPQYQDWSQNQAEIQARKTELKLRSDYFQNLKDSQARLEQYPEETDKVKSALPGDPSFPSLLNLVQNLSSQDNLVIKKIGFGATILVTEKPLVEKKTLLLEVVGSYPDFKKLLAALEKSSRLVQVDSLAFSLPEKGNTFLFSLTLSANFMPEIILGKQQ